MAIAEWRYLQPEKLTIDPNSHLAEEEWKFWLKTFTNFVEALPRGENTVDKLKVLTAHITSSRQMCALQKDENKSNENNVSVIASKKQSRNFTCYFCGWSKWHPRSRCPAKNEICDFCGKVGRPLCEMLFKTQKFFELRRSTLFSSDYGYAIHILTTCLS